MKLETYLAKRKIRVVDFAARIGIRSATVYRYLAGDRIPARAVMVRITLETGGKVTANDFFAEHLVAPMKEAS